MAAREGSSQSRTAPLSAQARPAKNLFLPSPLSPLPLRALRTLREAHPPVLPPSYKSSIRLKTPLLLSLCVSTRLPAPLISHNHNFSPRRPPSPPKALFFPSPLPKSPPRHDTVSHPPLVPKLHLGIERSGNSLTASVSPKGRGLRGHLIRTCPGSSTSTPSFPSGTWERTCPGSFTSIPPTRSRRTATPSVNLAPQSHSPSRSSREPPLSSPLANFANSA